jgi:hypothetical protein
MKYYSEHGQDKWLNENIFKDKTNGVYFEAGAYNGRDYSNSLFYADNLGWRGLLVEGNEAHITALKNNRPESIIENCIISDSAKPVNFAVVDCDGWSGILSSFAGGHKQRIQEHNFKTKLFHQGLKSIT